MAIERSLNGMGESIEGNAGEIGIDEVLEIEIEAPEILTLDDGSVEITLIAEGAEDLASAPFDANFSLKRSVGVSF